MSFPTIIIYFWILYYLFFNTDITSIITGNKNFYIGMLRNVPKSIAVMYAFCILSKIKLKYL